MISSEYIRQLQLQLATGNAREHSYRPALKQMFELLNEKITAVNEPNRSEHGAPDFIFRDKNNLFVYGYAETKDIYVDLDTVEKTSQLKRYLGYNNLLLTNYLEFRFFKNGEKYQTITLATKEGKNLLPREDNFVLLEREIKSFLEGKPQPITNAKRLAEVMGGKASRIRMNVERYLEVENEKNTELMRIYDVMRKLLVHDLKVEKFADMYAQTLVYGLFVARYYDTTQENFSRQEARDLIPASNPFLQQFFDHIVGSKFDKRLAYIVDELCEVFRVSDVRAIIQKHYNLFGEITEKDPIIHFYEDFLKEYDPKLRKLMGAYYTPVPVVHFIIKAVDEVLREEFNLPEGISSTEKITLPVVIQGIKSKETVHRVQILDPAVGTATFLNEVIKLIHSKFVDQEGLWASYVDKELLPRLYGFELMMAPYTIAHLKLAMTLKETGIEHFERRLGVYLTNTLEEGMKIPDDLFGSLGLTEAISREAEEAGKIKHDKPIMVIIGNPPYSGESSNKGAYATKLVENYKFEPGGKQRLQERNSKWLNDDYVKFIAFSQAMISKNGEGIVAMITNHSYLDNPTFRGMRWNLTTTYDTIYVLDLHGSSKKKEIAPDGSKDENVFDIQQGVSIIIAIKKTNKKRLADVYRGDVWGKRSEKFEFLSKNTVSSVKWEKIRLKEPMYLFLNRNEETEKSYDKSIKIDKLFLKNTLAFQTHRDHFSICSNEQEVSKKLSEFQDSSIDDQTLSQKYLLKDNRDWQLAAARNRLRNKGIQEELIIKCSYRPFDNRWTYFDETFSDYPRSLLKSQMLNQNNVSLEISKQISNFPWQHVFISDKPAESCLVSNRTKEGNYSFPLYLYSERQIGLGGMNSREPNLDLSLVKQILANIGEYNWVNDHEKKQLDDETIVSPLDIMDYVYANLHSPTYREKYKEFLKSNFPKIPIAKGRSDFWHLVSLGKQLRKLHLMMELVPLNELPAYPVSGNNIIDKIFYSEEKIFINDTQYFDRIPTTIWDFYVGGYQPAQKWLKDRKGRNLDFEEITNYQKLIFALKETIEIMKEIEKI